MLPALEERNDRNTAAAQEKYRYVNAHGKVGFIRLGSNAQQRVLRDTQSDVDKGQYLLFEFNGRLNEYLVF